MIDLHPKLLITICIVLPLILALVVLALRVRESENDVQVNLALLVFGGSLGWLLGIFMSPYGEGEKAAFAGYASAIMTFASGYLVGKIDPFVGKLLHPDFLFRTLVGFRVLSFLSIMLLSMLMTFAVREYLEEPSKDEINTLTGETTWTSKFLG